MSAFERTLNSISYRIVSYLTGARSDDGGPRPAVVGASDQHLGATVFKPTWRHTRVVDQRAVRESTAVCGRRQSAREARQRRALALDSCKLTNYKYVGWIGSRVVSVLDSGAEGPGFKSLPRRCRVTVLGKLFTPIVPLFTKQQNW